MSERITETELRAIEAKDPNDAGEDRWPVRDVQRLARDLRRLRGLIAHPIVEDVMMVGYAGRAYVTLLPEFVAEARAIREERDR